MALFSCICMLILLRETLFLGSLAIGHTEGGTMMIPTVFCMLGFLISIPLPKNGPYVVHWYLRVKDFLTVLPEMLSVVAEMIFHQKYIGLSWFCLWGCILILGAIRCKLLKLLYRF